MRIFGYLILLIRLVCYVSSSESNDVSRELYDQAYEILQQFPQFEDAMKVSAENKVNIDVPIDFDFEYEKRVYQNAIEELDSERSKVKQLLEESAALGNIDATFLLAEMNFYGNYSFPTNGSLALQYYHQVTELSPNSTAYFNLAFIYSNGFFGLMESDQAKANIYYRFAFEQGDLRAAMVLGYRYLYGISVIPDTATALFYYQYVADKMKEVYDNAPIGGPDFDSYAIRISDFQGGLYGKGVGDISTSLRRISTRFDDVLTSHVLDTDTVIFDELYYKVLKHYEGSYLRKRNYKEAFQLAKYVMEHGIQQLSELGSLDKNYIAGTIHILGRMYLRGEGVTQNFPEALSHLKKSIDIYPTAQAYNDLGLLYENGPEAVRSIEKAYNMYERSANLSSRSGTYNHARLTLPKDHEKGVKGIKKASYHLDIPAMYHHAEILASGATSNSKEIIIQHLKYYVENFDTYLTSLEWAFFELVNGRTQNGLIGYAMAAEQGFETAQVSAGFLLHQLPQILESEPPRIPIERKEVALTYFTRASMQSNVDSTVMVGDLYFSSQEYDKAAAAYEAASIRGSSQGSFNLAWLYEEGFGVEKDFHLAKRYYDLSLANHPKAYLPVQLTLLRLRFKSFINNITGGKINGINSDRKKRTWSDWKALYHKIRGTNDQNIDNSLNQEREHVIDTEDALGYEDLVMIGMMFIPFALIFIFHSFQQMQIRRRRANGENVPAPNFEFNFRIIAI